MPLSIRFATTRDADTIHRFVCQLAEYERQPDAVLATVDDFRRQLQEPRPPFECLLAEREGDGAVGFALFFHSYSTWRGRRGLYLEDLFVPPSLRGQGIGRALLTELARIAVARGCARMEWAVLDWNEPSIGFYRALGAEPLAEWTVYRLTGDALTDAAATK
jgi:GNAT superfamily N-acetyltransferase